MLSDPARRGIDDSARENRPYVHIASAHVAGQRQAARVDHSTQAGCNRIRVIDYLRKPRLSISPLYASGSCP